MERMYLFYIPGVNRCGLHLCGGMKVGNVENLERACAVAGLHCAHDCMRRDDALTILRAHELELRASGVLHLRLFGSVARDEAISSSAVDVLADFAPDQKISLWTLGRLHEQLVELLGCDVDLVREKKLLAGMREQVLGEAVSAF